LSSFVAEPSAIIPYFLLPGALALTLPGAWRLWAWPSITFCLVALSGTAAATFAVSAVALCWLILTRRQRAWAAAFPFLLAGGMLFIGTERFEMALRFVESNAPFPSKFRSGSERFLMMQEHWSLLRGLPQNPFGFSSYTPTGWTSLPLMTAIYFGIPGVVAQIWVLVRISGRLVDAFRLPTLPRPSRLGVALIFGVFAQATAGSCYGFLSASGVFLQALTIFHVTALIKRAAPPSVAESRARV
jgi:hypothetical protein